MAAILLGGAVTGLAVRRGTASPEDEVEVTLREAPASSDSAGRFVPDWWHSAEAACPDGARLVGAVPPEGFEVWCERSDGTRDGVHVRWHTNGREAFEGHYEDGVLEGEVTEWFPSGRRWRETVYDHGQRRSWTRWTEDGAIAEHVHLLRGAHRIR